ARQDSAGRQRARGKARLELGKPVSNLRQTLFGDGHSQSTTKSSNISAIPSSGRNSLIAPFDCPSRKSNEAIAYASPLVARSNRLGGLPVANSSSESPARR